MYRQVGNKAVFQFHHLILGIGGEALIQPSLLEFVACDHTVKILMPNLVHNGAFQIITRGRIVRAKRCNERWILHAAGTVTGFRRNHDG